ncbi:hypothetical protein PORY_000104 [Pneumocystis oryctolagi]|uniref:Uncharacterized protein n=1 Tax=Pneumocystis oryctolagi TaxID=42067 RepID=A0ACB7CEV8_9ASCO|nr:hypothetical protein PORY_000104 [Pneumocystis oryctolagi]
MSNWPLSTSETHICLSYGNPGAALYPSKKTNSEWIFVKNHTRTPLKALGNNILEYDGSSLFSEKKINLPSTTLQEKYLKTNYSDIWVPNNILNPRIKESTRIISAHNIHDPLRGNFLSECQVWDPENRNLSSRMLGFVSGNNSTEISLATIKHYSTTIYCNDDTRKKLKIPRVSEITESIFTSQTPIRQISSSSTYNGKYMLIRNYSFSSLIELIYLPSKHSLKNSHISSNPLITIQNSDTENYEHSDAVFDFSNKNQIIVINKKGNWSLWDIEGRYRTIEKSSSSILEDTEQNDGWWKMEWAFSPKSIIVSGRHKVGLFDFREPSKHLLLYSLPNFDNILDFYKISRNSNDFFILSTSEVYWLDERQPGKPLLSWKHYRSYDPSLKFIVNDFLGSMLYNILNWHFLISKLDFNVILYSNINPIKSCYQFSLKESLAFSSIFPYELPNSQNTSITSIVCPLNESNNKFENNDLENNTQFIKLYSLSSEKNIISQIYYYTDQNIDYTFHDYKSLHSVIKKSYKYVNDSSENEDSDKKKGLQKNEFYDNDFKLIDFSELYNEITNVKNFIFRRVCLKDQNNKKDQTLEDYKIFTLRDIYTLSEENSFDEIFSYLKDLFQEYAEKGWKIISLVPKSQKLMGFIDFVSESDNWNFKYIYDTLVKQLPDIQDPNNALKYKDLYEVLKDISIELGISSIGLEPPESFIKLKHSSNISLFDDSFKINQDHMEMNDIYSILDEWKVGTNPDLYKWQEIDKTSINDNITSFYEQISSAPPRITSTPSLSITQSSQTIDNLNYHEFSSQPVKKIKSKQRKAGF